MNTANYRRRFRTNAAAIVLTAPLLLMQTNLHADDFEINWRTIDAGGAAYASSGEFTMSWTVGQPDAGVTMTGGDFTFAGGYWSVVEWCFGDFRGDGVVNLSDLAHLLNNYNTPSGASYEDGDLDGDGDVDREDLAALLAVYGDACP